MLITKSSITDVKCIDDFVIHVYADFVFQGKYCCTVIVLNKKQTFIR